MERSDLSSQLDDEASVESSDLQAQAAPRLAPIARAVDRSNTVPTAEPQSTRDQKKLRPSQEATRNKGVHGAISDLIASGPKFFFGACLAMHLLAVFVTGILIATHSNSVFPIDSGPQWSYAVRDDKTIDREEAFNVATGDRSNDMWEKVFPQQDERVFRFKGEAIEIIYKGDCFTPTNLASIREFENKIYNSAAYQRICVRNTTGGTCQTPHSVVRFFDGSYLPFYDHTTLVRANDSTMPLFDGDTNFEAIKDIIDTTYLADGQATEPRIVNAGNPDIRKILNYNLGRPGTDFNANDPTTAKICRSKFEVGYPLAGFHNVAHEVRLQRKKMRGMQVDGLQSMLEDTDHVGNLKMYYSSKGLSEAFYSDSLILSWRLCIGSVLCGILGLAILTKSLFISFFTMIGMIGTFFWTNLIYRYIFQIEYFGLPQHTAAFICFYIGAVHMLSLYGAWVRCENVTVMSQRLHDSLSEVHVPMTATSLATAVCFWAFCFSPVVQPMPSSLFMGLLCVINYLTFKTYIPALLAAKSLVFNWHFDNDGNAHHREQAHWKWNRIIGHSWFRWVVLMLTTVLTFAMLILVVNGFQREKSQQHTYAHTNNFGQFDIYKDNEFGGATGDTNTRVRLVFGLDMPAKENCRPGSFNCAYKPEYTPGFDLSSKPAQDNMFDLCTEIESLSVSDVNNLAVRRRATGAAIPGGAYRPIEVNCWIKDQQSYLTSGGPNVSLELPYNFSDMQSTMLNNAAAYPPNVYRSTSYFDPIANSPSAPDCSRLTFCDTYYRHQELGLQDWLSNNGAAVPSDERIHTYLDLLGGIADSGLTKDGSTMTYAGPYGSYLRYAIIEINLTVNSNNQEFDEGIKLEEAWTAWLTEKVSTMTTAFTTAFQTTGEDRTWAWMKVQKNLEPSVVQGLCLSGLFFLIVVVLFSNNITLAVLALLVFCSVVITVLGIYVTADWKYEITELVNIAMIGGLIAEVITPIIMFYSQSDKADRHDKSRDALINSYLGVNGGVIISFIGGIFLLASPLWYFLNFSATFVMAIALSLFLGEFLLVVLLGIVGPERENGQILFRTTPRCQGVSSVAPELFSPQTAPTTEGGTTYNSAPGRQSITMNPVPVTNSSGTPIHSH